MHAGTATRMGTRRVKDDKEEVTGQEQGGRPPWHKEEEDSVLLEGNDFFCLACHRGTAAAHI